MRKTLGIGVVAALVVLAGVGGMLALRGGAGAAAQGTTGSSLEGAPKADGLISGAEYRHNMLDPQTGMALYWQNDSTTLFVGLVSPGTGWAAVGFSNRTGKPGSNIIIGCVRNGKVTIEDDYGVTTQLHLPDKASSLLATGGSESGGKTTLEFAIPLSNRDAQDVALVSGQDVAVILAYHATQDSFTAEHTRYSQVEITLD
jgi:hypothetical protein